MNTIKLSKEDKKIIAKKSSEDGFNEAIEIIYSEISIQKHEYILNELSLRHTVWTGFINTEINTAVVIETGLGAVVATISAVVDHVYAIYLDDDTKAIVEARVNKKEFKNRDINHYLISEVPKNLVFNYDETLLVAYAEGNTLVRNAFFKINDLYNINYYYFVDNSELFSKTGHNKYLTNAVRYHIEGTPRDPFKLTSQANKIYQFGGLKYFIFNIYSKYTGKYIVETNLNIDKSFYISVANEFFGIKSYNVRDIFFIKPNGILLLIECPDNQYMLRITSDELGKNRLYNNNSTLRLLNKKNIDFIPTLSGEKRISNHCCSVEECINGRNINSDDLNDKDIKEKIYKQAIEKLIIFQRLTLSQAILIDDTYDRLIKIPFLKSKSQFSSKFHHVFDVLEIYIKNSFSNKTLPLVLYHGDYSADNLMIQNENITGIIDWEYAIQNCLPLMDLIFLFCNVFKKQNNVSIIRAMYEVVILENIGKNENDEIYLYCETFNIKKNLIKPLSIMCIVYFIAYRLESNSKISRSGMFDENFSNLLLAIKKSLNI